MDSKQRHANRYARRKARRDAKRNEIYSDCFDYNAVFSFKHLWKSYHKCCKNVGWKQSTQNVKNRPLTTVVMIYDDLMNRRYKGKGIYGFYVMDRGKLRRIESVHVTERIVQACLCNYSLVKVLSSTLIYDNSATLPKKGITFAIKRTKKMLRKAYLKGYDYCWRIDNKDYFNTLWHDYINYILNKYYADKDLVMMAMLFVRNHGTIGLGLGSQGVADLRSYLW